MLNITGGVRVYCVIGDPIEHSLSPIMHNRAFEKMGIDAIFIPFRVKKRLLSDAISGIRGLDIHGFNVTIPHKTSIIIHLDEVDPTAMDIGAVNIVHNIKGRLVGYNSDGLGAIRTLEENQIQLGKSNVVIVGAGGAAKAISYQLIERCRRLVILNRTVVSANSLASKLRTRFNREVYSYRLSNRNLKESLKDAHLLINTTSIGMYPRIDQSLVDKNILRPGLCVFDIIYNPVETRLLRDARTIGAKTISGVDMLVYQGALAFEEWTGCRAPIEVMKKAVLSKLR
jgi:shikimate dehydrogenase